MKGRTEEQRLSSKKSSICVYTVDSFANGIAFGQHRTEEDDDPRDVYGLRIDEDAEMIRLRSRYTIHNEKPLYELERNLMRLSSQGVLGSSVIYFGTTTDPFHPFEGKFDASMKFLELFRRYTPGMLQVQTRSPLIVLALPVFKALGKHVAVTVGIETSDEASALRYTPQLPRLEERLKTAAALRRFGIEVCLQVSPILPYGDWKQDAEQFAQILVDHGDRIYIAPLTDGSERVERQIRNTVLAKKLAEDRKFYWLRPDSAVPLISAVEKLAPEKLSVPQREHLKSKQMEMFAA
jgi:DNA repair photolyase